MFSKTAWLFAVCLLGQWTCNHVSARDAAVDVSLEGTNILDLHGSIRGSDVALAKTIHVEDHSAEESNEDRNLGGWSYGSYYW